MREREYYQIARHKGRVVDPAGDSVLAVFESAVEATEAAREIQQDLDRRNRLLEEHRQMRFRIGLNLGDVIVREWHRVRRWGEHRRAFGIAGRARQLLYLGNGL